MSEPDYIAKKMALRTHFAKSSKTVIEDVADEIQKRNPNMPRRVAVDRALQDARVSDVVRAERDAEFALR